MNYKEYKGKRRDIEAEISKLEELKGSAKDKIKELDKLYGEEHGYPVGTAVKANDNMKSSKFYVSEVNVWAETVLMNIRKAKKDGQPAMVGFTRYGMRKEELELWSDNNGL